MSSCGVEGCAREIPDTCYTCPQCGQHLTNLLTAITDTPHLDGLANDLDDAAATRPTPIPDATPLPYSYTVAEARWTLHNTLHATARHIATTRGLPTPTSSNLQTLAQSLLPHIQWLRQRPDGPDTITELIEAIQNAIRAVDVSPARVYAGPCGAVLQGSEGVSGVSDEARCGAELYAVEGRGSVECRGCGATYDLAARREWLLSEADDQLCTGPELARALTSLGHPVTERSIQRWAATGVLVRRGSRAGRAVYRVGDARALVATMRPHRWRDALSQLTT